MNFNFYEHDSNNISNPYVSYQTNFTTAEIEDIHFRGKDVEHIPTSIRNIAPIVAPVVYTIIDGDPFVRKEGLPPRARTPNYKSAFFQKK